MKPASWMAGGHGDGLVRTVFVGAAVLAGGCLVIPVDYHDPGSRHNITAASATRFQPGVTSREEVILALGEPDHASDDDRRMGYAWTKVKALIIVASYSGGSAELKRSYILELNFDAAGRFVDSRLVKQWGPEVSPRSADAP